MPTANRLLIYGARELVTVRGPRRPRRGEELNQLHIIEDGAVYIEEGMIREVGPTRRVENLACTRGAPVVAAHGRVVLPAFVDAYTHTLSHDARQRQARVDPPPTDAAFLVDAYRSAALLPPSRLQFTAEGALAAMLRHGTGAAQVVAVDSKGLMTISRSNSLVDVSPGFSVLEPRGKDELEAVYRRRLTRSVGVFADEGALNTGAAESVLIRARELGLATRVSAGMFSPPRALAPALRLGVSFAAHLNLAASDDITMLALSSTMAVLLPGLAFHLGISYAPARDMADRGVPIALGTGFGPATNPSYTMSSAVALAVRKLRLTPAEAISAATINAAHALGIANRVGSLEYGKQADLIMLDAADHRALAYELGVNSVCMVIKRGEIVYDAGRAWVKR